MNNFYIVVGKYKFSLLIVLICIVILYVLFGHLLCGCMKTSYLEAFETVTGKKVDVQIKKKPAKKEGFSGMTKPTMKTGEVFSSFPENKLNTNNWGNPSLNVGSVDYEKLNSYPQTPLPLKNGDMFMFSKTPFKPECCAYGETYSNSSGCACMNLDSVKYLWQRGGNNVPYIAGSSI